MGIVTTSDQNCASLTEPRRTTTLPIDQWKTQRKKRSTATVQTTIPLGELVGSPKVRKKVFYVGGIAPTCTAEDLLLYCEDSCPLLDCRLMPSRRTGTRSACVEAAEDLSQRFASITWPENVYAHPWTFNDRQTSKSRTIAEHEDPPRSMNVQTRQVGAELLQSSSSDSTNMNFLQRSLMRTPGNFRRTSQTTAKPSKINELQIWYFNARSFFSKKAELNEFLRNNQSVTHIVMIE